MAEIRLAKADDLSAVGGLLEQVLAVHHKGRPDLFRAAGKKYTDADLLALIGSTPIFVYADGGAVRGYAFCRAEFADGPSRQPVKTLYIDDICVDEASRGQHIGQALYAHVREYARLNGFYNITLHVWECNPGARAFYEKLGLRPQFTCMEEIVGGGL